MKQAFQLSLAVFGGGAAIYAILWLLANYTSLNASKTLVLFLPLSLLWLTACIVWSTLRARRKQRGHNEKPIKEVRK
jgi:membrane protein implicated in regulation of membrane protease activity